MRFIVYKHTSPSNKVYIGITCQNPIRRWGNGGGYKHNEYFYRAILKYGWVNFKHEILFENLTQQEAEQKEIELISYYHSTDNHYGYNIQNGGNFAGKHTEQSRLKMSKSQRGRKDTDITKQLKSNSHIVRRVVQLDKESNVIKIWNGFSTAGKALHIPPQNISECLKHRNGRTQAGGYKWRYLDELE